MIDAVGDLLAYLSTEENWWGSGGIVLLTWNHLRLSVAVMIVAAALTIPPAVVLGHRKRGGFLAVSVVNIGRALPTFGIIALVLPFSLRLGFGLGYWPTFVNAYTGVRGVPEDVVEAARAMGMTERQVLTGVELPTALPLVVTGLRISSVQVVATATLGALVGYRCLGTLIIAGLNEQRTFGPGKLLAGAVIVGILSIITEVVLGRAERRLTPWTRLQPGRGGLTDREPLESVGEIAVPERGAKTLLTVLRTGRRRPESGQTPRD